jgi:hypothetical protein
MFISYNQWMRGTKLGLTKPRSSKLKKLDLALEQYDLLRTQKQLSFLRAEFATWKLSKVEWEESKRNYKNMVTDLEKMLNQSDLLLSPMDAILEEQKKLLQNLFRERKLHSRSLFGLEKKKKSTALNQLKKVSDGASAIEEAIKGGSLDSSSNSYSMQQKVLNTVDNSSNSSAMQQKVLNTVDNSSNSSAMQQKVLNLVGDLFNNAGSIDEIKVEIAAELGGDFLADLIAEMVPYAGVLRSGYNVINNWKKTAKYAYANYKVNKVAYVTKAGDARKAVTAIEECLERQIKHYGIKTTRSTVSFSAKVAVHATGAGALGDPIIGGVSAMASIMQLIYEIGVDFQEKKAINKLINSGDPLDHRVFDVCPLLGAYYMVCTNTSDVLDIMNENYGTAEWLNEVEDLAHKVNKIKKSSRKIIDKHRYYFDDMPNLKMSKDMMKKKGIKISKKDKLTFYLNQKRASIPL